MSSQLIKLLTFFLTLWFAALQLLIASFSSSYIPKFSNSNNIEMSLASIVEQLKSIFKLKPSTQIG